jgi:hypothetical protein
MSNVKTDCFAYENRVHADGSRKEICKAMTALYCKNGECKFYKSAEQACKECTYEDCKGCPNPLAVVV